jgi:hypothetical protein
MELYAGPLGFQMEGNGSSHHICMAKVAVAGKLKEALMALRFMAITRNMGQLHQQIGIAYEQIDRSGEDAGLPCRARTV